MGYLKKYPKRGYLIDPRPPIIEDESNLKRKKEIDFGNQYKDFEEEIDPKFPEPLCKELDINIFVDSNHGQNKVTGKSLTGLVSFVGRTPINGNTKRQPSTQVATYGAEFIAMRRGVEEAVSLR